MEQTKVCSVCGQEKPLSEFNKNKNRADGLQEKCRACFSEYNRRRYLSNPEKFKKAAKARRDFDPRADFETRVKACKKNPTKKNAYMAVDAAVRAGVIERPDHCTGCGCPDTEHRIEAHHASYERPLEVVWLCTPCHRRLDQQRRKYEESSRGNDGNEG